VPDVPVAPPDVPDEPLAPPEVPLAPLEDGRFRSTSPADVPVVVPPAAALPVDGTQFDADAPVPDVVLDVMPPVAPMPLVLAPLVLPAAPALVPEAPPVEALAPAPALIPPVVLAAPVVLPLAELPADRVVVSVPAPFAPFVALSPVSR
jgi:hypothetical protein